MLERPDDEIIYDHTSKDEILYSGTDTEKAQGLRQSFQSFLKENQDKVLALHILYSQPYSDKQLTLAAVQDLHDALKNAKLSAPVLWSTIAQLEPDKVKHKTPTNQLTDIISLIRFEMGKRETLFDFEDEVKLKLDHWLERKATEGVSFDEEQKQWLGLIAEHIATALVVDKDSLGTPALHPEAAFTRRCRCLGMIKVNCLA